MRYGLAAGRRLVRHITTRVVYRVISERIKIIKSNGEIVDGVFFSDGLEDFARDKEVFEELFEPLVCSRCNGERQKDQEIERWVGMSGVGWCCATAQEIHDNMIHTDFMDNSLKRTEDRYMRSLFRDEVAQDDDM